MMRPIAEQKGAIAQQSKAYVEEPLPARPAGRLASSEPNPSDEQPHAGMPGACWTGCCGSTPPDQASGDEPVRWTDINGKKHTTAPGTVRSFSLNSEEFYEAVREPRERPWIPNGALGREPRAPTPTVIVDRKRR